MATQEPIASDEKEGEEKSRALTEMNAPMMPVDVQDGDEEEVEKSGKGAPGGENSEEKSAFTVVQGSHSRPPRVLLACGDGSVALVEPSRSLEKCHEMGSVPQSFDGHGSENVLSIVGDSESNMALSGAAGGGKMRLWNLKAQKCTEHLEGGGETHECRGIAANFSLNRALCSAGSSGAIKLWDLKSKKCLKILHAGSPVMGVAADFELQRAISVGKLGIIEVWDLNKDAATSKLVSKALIGDVLSVSADFKANRAVTACNTGIVQVWDLECAQCLGSMKVIGHGEVRHSINSISADFNSHRAISGASDHDLTFWDLTALRSTVTLVGHNSGVTSVAADFGSMTVASGSSDHLMKVWDMLTMRCMHTFKATGGVNAVCLV